MTRFTNIIGRRFDKLTPKRDIYLDGTLFFCTCECGNTREVSREALMTKSVHSCHSCTAAHRKLTSARRETVKPESTPEPLARIVLPPCIGCTFRVIRRERFFAASPSCPRHSPFREVSGVSWLQKRTVMEGL